MMHGNMPQKHQTSRTDTGGAFKSGHRLSLSTQADTETAAHFTNLTLHLLGGRNVGIKSAEERIERPKTEFFS